MSRPARSNPTRPGPGGATLAVNARPPYTVITFSFGDARQPGPFDMGPPKLEALVLMRPEDASWVRAAEQDQRELICVLDPASPESQIGAFTFMGRVTGLRDLRDGLLAAEFTSIGPVTPHFLRG